MFHVKHFKKILFHVKHFKKDMHNFTTVKKGKSGADVLVCQTVLSLLHYTGSDGKPIEIDGVCGANTVFAINSFQSNMRAYGYECGSNGKNDGCFGEACWKVLGVM